MIAFDFVLGYIIGVRHPNNMHLHIHMAQALLSCVVALVLAATALAQPIRWEGTNGPGGGLLMESIVADSASRLYSVSRCGIYRSLDKGISWKLLRPNRLLEAIFDIAVESEGRIFAAANSVGMLRSTDHGDSWTLVDSTGKTPGDGYASLLVTNTNEILVIFLTGKSRRSTDHGDTWIDGPTVQNTALAIDSNGTFITPYRFGGILRSTDDGATWVAANTGLPATSGAYPSIVDIIVVRPGTLLCGTEYNGVFKSVDGGETWQTVDTVGIDERVLWLARAQGTTIYRGSYSAVYKSTDDGTHWVRTPFTEWPTRRGRKFIALSNNWFYLLANGIRRSEDGGTTFIPSDSSIPNSDVQSLFMGENDVLYAASGHHGITRSSDQGDSWVLPGVDSLSRSIYFNGICKGTEKSLFAWSTSGLYHSVDGGARFVRTNDPAAGSGLRSCIVSPDGALIAITSSAGLYRTTDEGNRWEKMSFGFTQNDATSLGFDSSGGMYAAMDSRGVLRSFDRGATWEESVDSINQQSRRIFHVISTRTGILYADDSRLVWRSTDRGEHWVTLPDPLSMLNTQGNIYDIAVNSNGDLFIALPSGVARSTDNGMTWEMLEEGNSPFYPQRLVFDRTDRLFVGTAGCGVYRTTGRTSSAPVSRHNSPTAADGLTLSPNPTSSSVQLSFSLGEPQQLEICVVDNRGRTVRNYPSRKLGLGAQTLELSVTDLPSGEYHLIVRSERGESVVPLVVVL